MKATGTEKGINEDRKAQHPKNNAILPPRRLKVAEVSGGFDTFYVMACASIDDA
jgi:hypothetical protein